MDIRIFSIHYNAETLHAAMSTPEMLVFLAKLPSLKYSLVTSSHSLPNAAAMRSYLWPSI